MKVNSPIQRLIDLLTSTVSEPLLTKPVSARKEASQQSSSDNAKAFDPQDYPQPFKPLPNVSRLWLRTSKLDPLLAKHGLAKKLEPEMAFEERSHRIKAANRYLRIMHYRLSKLLYLNQPVMFWILALQLMQRSKVLRAVALRKLDSNWFRAFKFGAVKALLSRLDFYIENLQTEMFIVRNYASKVKADGSKTYRPIGNPGYTDRMYLYLWQSFFVMFFAQDISKSQHAYIPGRGVPTALKELAALLRTPKYKFIYEFDLKGAFPSVKIPEACMTMRQSFDLPPAIARHIETMSLMTIERVDLSPPDQFRLLDEPKFDRQVDISASEMFHSEPDIKRDLVGQLTNSLQDLLGGLGSGSSFGAEISLSPTWKKPSFVPPKADPIELTDFVSKGHDSGHQQRVSSLATFAKTESDKGWGGLESRGFPQGSAISPILFNLVFEFAALRGHFNKLSDHIKLVSYADDFIVFSTIDLSPEIWEASQIMDEHGLEFNLEKSRVIRTDEGFKVKSFKFLGTTFHVGEGPVLLEGTPRSGARLMFDKSNMIAAFKVRDQQLAKFAKKLSPENPKSPQAILNGWGRGELPFNLIPFEVISGQSRLDNQTIDKILAVSERLALENSTSEDEPSDMPDNQSDFEGFGSGDGDGSPSPKPSSAGNRGSDPDIQVRDPSSRMRAFRKGGLRNLTERDEAKLAKLDLSLTRDRVSTTRKASVSEMLNTRLSGLVINRLHGGSWQNSAQWPDRSLRSSNRAAGRSWLDLKTLTAERDSASSSILGPLNQKGLTSLRAALDSGQTLREFLDGLSIHNASTHATLDSLNYLQDPSKFKIRKGGFKPAS